MSNYLTVIGALLTMLWGIAHLLPTKSVVRDFGEISEDNKNIIRMEWINEGLTLIFLGSLLLISLAITGGIVVFISIMVLVMLVMMALVSYFTGFRVRYLPFKLCPVIFFVSACLIGLDLII